MRISDWSSDVCSSDLVSGDSFAPELLFLFISASIGKDDRQRHLAVAEIVACILAHGLFIRRIVDGVVHELKGERKSVVKGKSVSVRVDLGGRRLINNTIESNYDCMTISDYKYP